MTRSAGPYRQAESMHCNGPLHCRRRHGKQELADEGILGSGDFVERVIRNALLIDSPYFSHSEQTLPLLKTIEAVQIVQAVQSLGSVQNV
jgi:hypothetical protein